MFNVSDLKPGMLVKLANHRYGVLIPIAKGLAVIGRYNKCNNNELSILTDNVRLCTDKCVDDYSIVKVYGLAYSNSADFFLPGNRECLWEYRYAKEMTIAEIEKLLGYRIKIVENLK